MRVGFFRNREEEFNVKLDLYLRHVDSIVPNFKNAMNAYLTSELEYFDWYVKRLVYIENEADQVLKAINHHIYAYMLYPDLQKDISRLLNTLDDIVDTTKQVVLQMSIEKPIIYDFLQKRFSDLTEASCNSIIHVGGAVNSFFYKSQLLDDHINKIFFYENEADRLEGIIKRNVFQAESINALSKKQHLSHFAEKVALPSDKAYRIAKDLLIYNINKENYKD